MNPPRPSLHRPGKRRMGAGAVRMAAFLASALFGVAIALFGQPAEG